jgi:hypothetical protein
MGVIFSRCLGKTNTTPQSRREEVPFRAALTIPPPTVRVAEPTPPAPYLFQTTMRDRDESNEVVKRCIVDLEGETKKLKSKYPQCGTTPNNIQIGSELANVMIGKTKVPNYQFVGDAPYDVDIRMLSDRVFELRNLVCSELENAHKIGIDVTKEEVIGELAKLGSSVMGTEIHKIDISNPSSWGFRGEPQSNLRR